MAYLIDLKTVSDSKGNLTVIEKALPFDIKRVYYIYNVGHSITRGGHRHFSTIQAAVCVKGECVIETDNGKENNSFSLNSPEKCLVLNPDDWHSMSNFSEDCVLLVLASENYSPEDYIYEKY